MYKKIAFVGKLWAIWIAMMLYSSSILAQTALTVNIIHPQLAAVPESITGNGYIEPKTPVMVNARLSGATLDSIHAELGDVVQKGQILARFDDALIKSAIERARAQVAQAETALRQARNNAARARRLLKVNAMSKVDGERYLDGEADAQAQLNAARAALRAQTLQLTYTKVIAPVSGVISAKTAVLGATVNIGTPLFQIIQNGTLSWRAQVPMTGIARIHNGTTAIIHLPDGQTIQGSVYNIAPTVNPQSREVSVFVRLPHNDDVRSGMLLSGDFQIGSKQALLIPAKTIQPNDGYNDVWIVGPDNTAHRQRITLGKQIGNQVEVVSGLDKNSRIIARGGGFLAEGDKVHVVAQPEEASK